MRKQKLGKQKVEIQHPGRRPALLISAFCFLLSTFAFGANWFLNANILSGSPNNGSSWSAAWTNVSSVVWGAGGLGAGDTLYVAGGLWYTNDSVGGIVLPGASGTIAAPITIRRARGTNSACSSAAGWLSVYDTQPVLIGFVAPAGYSNIVINGEIPYTGMMWTNRTFAVSTYTFDLRYGFTNLTVSNCCIRANGYTNLVTDPAETRCWLSDQCQSNHLAFCDIGNACTILAVETDTGFTVEHCVLHDSVAGPGSTLHENVFMAVGVNNCTFRWNVISNWFVEGIMFTTGGGPPSTNWAIYGTFWLPLPASGTSSRVLEADSGTNGPIKFFNNTVLTNHFGIMAGGVTGGYWTNCTAMNNIFFGNPAIDFGTDSGGVSDYNLTDLAVANGAHTITSAVYANTFSEFDHFHIVGTVGPALPAGKGFNLGAPYNVDLDGNVQPASWSIGAFVAPGLGTSINGGRINGGVILH